MGAKQSFPRVHIDKDRTYLVTGANRGIGYEVTKWIAMLGGTVVMACRSEDDAMKAMRQMDKEYKQEKEIGTKGLTDVEELSLIFMRLDLSSFESTKEFVQEYKNSGRSLHAIVCNAGIVKAKAELTGDGFEFMLQVNYLSHFLLIGQLLPLLKKNECDSRIVMVSSDAHKWAKYDLATMNFTDDPAKFKYFDYYGRSKMYQIMQMFSLERRLRNTNITVTSVHPGMVDTDIGHEMKDVALYQALKSLAGMLGIMKKPIDGATTVINCAINPEYTDKRSDYYIDCKPASMTSVCKDETKQEELWIKTMTLLRDHFNQEEIYCLEGADPQVNEQNTGGAGRKVTEQNTGGADSEVNEQDTGRADPQVNEQDTGRADPQVNEQNTGKADPKVNKQNTEGGDPEVNEQNT